jgi:hypothetical protein
VISSQAQGEVSQGWDSGYPLSRQQVNPAFHPARKFLSEDTTTTNLQKRNSEKMI